MPRKKRDDVEKDTLVFSLILGVDRAIKALSLHAANNSLCDDLRNLIKLSKPFTDKYLSDKTLVTGTTEIEQ